jgi:hypothetical protein
MLEGQRTRHQCPEFDKAMTVAKLRGARERIRKEMGKCEGRKSFAETDAEDGTDIVAQAKRLHRASPKTGKRRSLREIAKELAALGYLNERGQVFNPKSVKRMLEQ